MRAAFGAVSLLVVLTCVALLAARQFKTAVPNVAAPGAAVASAPVSGNSSDQVQRVQQQVSADVVKALEKGAAARNDDAEK